MSSAIWLGHELVAFGSNACENCGNERLRHLHTIRMEDGRTLRVGCVCAANLCYGQADEIKGAERAMNKLDRGLKALAVFKWEKVKGVWKAIHGRKTITVERQIGGWVVIGLKLGEYFGRDEDAKRAVEKELFGIAR